MSVSPTDITVLLEQAEAGDQQATDQLLPLVYDELRRLAQHFLAKERPDHTLQATALVHEAYLRLVNQRQTKWGNRNHFFALAAKMIRRILVDHARARRTTKRGGDALRLTLHESALLEDKGNATLDLLALDDALEALSRLNERQARVVELKFFGGLTTDDAASVLAISPRTVKDDWRFARAWLRTQLSAGGPS